MRAFYCSKNEVLVVYFLLYQENCFVLWVSLYEKWTLEILIVPVAKLMDFNPHTAFQIPFKEPTPVISHLLKFAFSLEKRENTLNVSISH